MILRFIPFVLGAPLLSTSAYAQPRHHHLSPMRIVIETIDHSKRHRQLGGFATLARTCRGE
jgi:hypothetical protein